MKAMFLVVAWPRLLHLFAAPPRRDNPSAAHLTCLARTLDILLFPRYRLQIPLGHKLRDPNSKPQQTQNQQANENDFKYYPELQCVFSSLGDLLQLRTLPPEGDFRVSSAEQYLQSCFSATASAEPPPPRPALQLTTTTSSSSSNEEPVCCATNLSKRHRNCENIETAPGSLPVAVHRLLLLLVLQQRQQLRPVAFPARIFPSHHVTDHLRFLVYCWNRTIRPEFGTDRVRSSSPIPSSMASKSLSLAGNALSRLN